MVDRIGDRNIELLLVTDNGAVQNVSSSLKQGTDAKLFNIDMKQREGVSGSQPQLLMAVSSGRPLQALRRPLAAEQFFAAVTSEAARTGQPVAATARYFKFEK
jgi:hypothetical protein